MLIKNSYPLLFFFFIIITTLHHLTYHRLLFCQKNSFFLFFSPSLMFYNNDQIKQHNQVDFNSSQSFTYLVENMFINYHHSSMLHSLIEPVLLGTWKRGTSSFCSKIFTVCMVNKKAL